MTSDVRVAPGDMLRIRTERWRVEAFTPYDACAIVGVAGIDATNRGRRERFVLPFEPADRIAADDTPAIVRPARWRRSARAILADATPSPATLRTAARADLKLMPFQLEPALAIIRGLGVRVLIADAVGLGKTIQAALVVAEVFARTPDAHAIVVCPSGLREQWRQEIDSRFGLSAGIVDSTLARLPDVHASPWTSHPVVICSIDYVKRPEVIRGLEDMVWDVVVFDEAHWLAGHSDRATAASTIAARGRVVVTLTATPHSGDTDAFRRLSGIGGLPGDRPLLMFRRQRQDVGMAVSRRMRWLSVRCTDSERRMHAALVAYTRTVWRASNAPGARLAMSVLTRRACSGAQSLARSLERRLALLANPRDSDVQLALPFDAPLDDEPAAELATPGLADLADERRQLNEILERARESMAGDSKLRWLRRFLDRTGEHAIVFTEYRDTLAHVAQSLQHHDFVQIHGGLTLAERRDAARRFAEGTSRILLATDAGSEGLNLHQRCRLVINLDVPWTPPRLEQRIGRVDRIGQQYSVHAICLIATGTAEDVCVRRLFERELRARESLDAIAHLDADAIAAAAIGGGDVPAPHEHGHLDVTDGVITPDLRQASKIESQRLAQTRAMSAAAAIQVSRRAPVAVVRRTGSAPRGYWIWMLPIVGPDGEWVWQAVIGVACPTPSVRDVSHAEVRRLLSAFHGAVEEAATQAHARAVDVFREPMRGSLSCAIAREHAIASAMTSGRAGRAAALVQRSLFDARTERRAALREACVDAAIARCNLRLNWLERMGEVRAGDRRLALGLLLR
jgi:superfamily II DNA or RNA helicase